MCLASRDVMTLLPRLRDAPVVRPNTFDTPVLRWFGFRYAAVAHACPRK